MSTTNGGRWLILRPAGFSTTVVGFNNGTGPAPQPVAGAFNVEVFTNPALDIPIDSKIDRRDEFGNIVPIFALPAVPPPDAGFQTSIADVGGTIENGFLTGVKIRLTTGDFLILDSTTGAAGQSGSQITLGSGNQTVIGARFDTLIGGSGKQVLSALAGNQTVVGGFGADGGNATESIWGGANDSIVSAGNAQIVVTGAGTTVVSGVAGNATISATAQNTIRGPSISLQNIAIAAGQNNLIDLTGNIGSVVVIGATGDTITAGGSTTNIEGAAGGMLIKIGAAGTTNLSGSASMVAGNTVTGGTGGFNFNPSAVAGKGDLINLSGSTGTATINAFAFQSTRVVAQDTILATNNADSIFGGDGDRIGTGNGSVVGGTHQWVHADAVGGSSIGFGSNDTVASTTYDTIAHTATRGTVAGTSSAQVTVGGFNTTTDFIFYQNETAQLTTNIIATAQSTSILGPTDSSVITLPDGTVMTLVGITQAQLSPGLFKA
jgi:hypothetical protein